MSLDDLIVSENKRKHNISAKKPRRIKKDIVNSSSTTKKVVGVDKTKSKKMNKIFEALDIDVSETIFTFEEFEKWFVEMSDKLPYFRAYIKQKNKHGKKTDIVSHYFACLFYVQTMLNKQLKKRSS